jgi:hypothetical protein
MKKAFCIAILLLGIVATDVFSQVDVKIIVRNPIPSEISVWAEDPTVIQVIITNTTSTEYQNCFLGFSIFDDSGNTVARTDIKSPVIPRFNVPSAPSVNVLGGDRVFNVNSVNFDSRLQRLAVFTNSIPEGNYEMCISVYNQMGENITIGEEYCTGFSILIPEPPVLIMPVDDEVIVNQYPVFTWTPVVNYNPGRNQIKYKLKICPVFSGQGPREAIERNQVLFEKNDIYSSTYQYLPSDMSFDYFPGVNRFVWIVQAFDVNNNPASSNRGLSEPGIFRLEDISGEFAMLDNVYPENNDTIPWLTPHLMVALTPPSQHVRIINVNLTVHDESSSEVYTNSHEVQFAEGPMSSQNLTEANKSGWIVANLDANKSFPPWMQNLQTGKKYYWNVEAVFTNTDGSSFTKTTSETAFVIGLKKPASLLPKADTSIRANHKINLELTIPEPNNLNMLSTVELENPLFHAANSYSNAGAKLRFELSKKENFDSLLQTKDLNVPENEILTGANWDALFNKISSNLNAVSDTGSYFWRFKYMDKADSAYYTSSARKIKIVPDSIYNCFELEVFQPANDGVWNNNKKPRFAVTVKPEIKKKHIKGGRFRLWEKSGESQSTENAKLSKAKIDTTFKGNADSILYAYAPDINGNTRLDINFINGGSKSKSFEGKLNSYYVWNMKLKYDKDSIRKDGDVCGADSLISNDGVFQLLESDKNKNSCPGDCYAEAPSNTTAGSQTLAKDSTIKIGKFDLKLISVSGDPSGLSGTGTIKIPYIKANVLVEFNGLKVNSDKKVFEGEAFAKVDTDAPYTKQEGNDFQDKAYGFASDQLKFKEIHEHSSSLGKLVSGFTGSEAVTLPLGYDHNWDGYNFIIGIVGMKFTPTHGEMNVATYVELPSLGPDVGLGFGAKNICFHNDGFGGMEKVILYLAQDFGYDSSDSWSFLFKAPTPSDSGTYVMWDCTSLSDMTIAADVTFPRNWMKPAENTDPASRVSAHFKARARKYGSSWQWLASAAIDEFVLADADGYKMTVDEVVYDWSDALNPTAMVFPEHYTGKKTANWKGFYIKRATVSLPDDFKTFKNNHPTFAVENVLIDELGFSGSIIGTNLIQYPKGDFGGWGASIDSLRIDMLSSSLQSGSMGGRLRMSIADSCLYYSGVIAKDMTDNSSTHTRDVMYQFSISPKDTFKVDMFGKADFNLLNTSTIEMHNDEMNKFKAIADLSGSVTIPGSLGGLSKLNIKGVKFKNLKVMNYGSIIENGDWSMASPQHGMSGFPISINNIDMVTGSRDGGIGAGLQFDLTVGLQDGANAISGTTRLSIWGKLSTEPGPQRFVFDGVDLDSIGIDADLGAVVIDGGLMLYDSHATFGDGFMGGVTATFIDQATVEATAQFGSVNNYRYWYVDGKAMFNEGVPLFSGLGVYGFGGGAWYHMSKTGEVVLDEEEAASGNSTSPGSAHSGFSYEPDNSVDLGLSASMVMGTHPSPEAFNGDVGLDAQFLSDGGIGTISLTGKGYMLCGVAGRNKAKILADMDMEYNFPEQTFHGVFDVDINASPLDGGGQMTAHFDPDLWYVKVGEPSNRISIDLDSWLSTDGYFMIGQDLPSPQLPSQILELFPDYTVYRNPAIEMGDGFAFGASSSFETGRKPYLIFYGKVSALVGFDMALLNYGEGTRCEGMSGSVGVNGWYAMGQIYASVAATIGMHVDLWFTSGDYEILDMQAGAALQGAGPNPTWVKGMVGGNYRILSGAVKGHCNYQFKMGDECEMMIENPLSRIDLISDISPVSGQKNVDVYTEPQVAMNFEIDTPFELREMPSGGGGATIRTFRIKLDDFYLRRTSGEDSIPGYLNIGSDKFSAYYKPHDIMGGNRYHRFSASAYGEEYIDGNWGIAKKNDGSVIKQNVVSTFKTGAAPDVIMHQNVAYTYPVNLQRYFLQDECRNGRVQLISGRPGLFTPRESYDMELIARFIPVDFNMNPVEVPFTYNSGSRAILFDIPNLINNKRYFLQFVKREVCNDPDVAQMQQLINTIQSGGLQPDITINERKEFDSGGSSAYISERKITADRVNPNEKLLYVISFRTSSYNTLQAKLSTFNHVSTQSEFGYSNYETHTAEYVGAEYFDRYDFEPVQWTTSGNSHQFGPLVKINASLRTSVWHENFANPDVYGQINWMRNNGFLSGYSEYDTYMYDDDYSFIEIDHSRYHVGMNELLSIMQGTGGSGSSLSGGSGSSGISPGVIGGGFSPGVNVQNVQSILGSSNEAPNLVLTYNHGLIVPVDFNRMKYRSLSVLSNPFISKSSNEMYRLNTILDKTYTPMLNGNYPLLFFYNYFGCQNVDESASGVSKPFVY